MKNKLKENWQPRWKTNMPSKWERKELIHPSDLTNSQRMKVRAQARKEAKEILNARNS